MIEVKLDIKPIPVPLTYQPIYKVVILLAILKYGCSKPFKATFLKLHLYMWSLRSVKNYNILKAISKGKRNTILPWTYEPGLEKIVTLSLINSYCTKQISSNELQLQITEIGIKLLSVIEINGYFREDINKIKIIGNIPQNKLLLANSNWQTK